MQKGQTRLNSASGTKGVLKNSRQMDNHYDPKIHQKPWIAPGVFPAQKMVTYEHDDSGLGVISKKTQKFKNFRELYEINAEVVKLQETGFFRRFREYDNIQDGEIIITIEYCTNCDEHSGSTRHDEEKYFSTASNLKKELIQQYPMSKVYLKPLVYDPNDISVDTLFIQRRIGAFEVQVCSKHKGDVKKGTVFSKLSNKTWPVFGEVSNNIVNFLPTIKLSVLLSFEEGQTGNLKDVEVCLIPYRQQIDNINQSAQRNASKNNTINITENDQKQSQSNQFQNNIYIQLDTDKRPYSSVSKQSTSRRLYNKQRKYSEKSDLKGQVIFNLVPIDQYTLEVSESTDYQTFTSLVNLYEFEQGQDKVEVAVILKKQNYASLMINVYTDTDGIAKVEVFHEESMQSMIARELKSGTYEIVVEPGLYAIQIQKPGYKEYREVVQAQRGLNILKYTLEKLNNSIQNILPSDITKPSSAAKQLKPIQQQLLQQPSQQQQQQPQRNTSARPTSAARSQKQDESKTQSIEPNQKKNQQQELDQQTEVSMQDRRPISGAKNTIVFIYDPYTNLPIQNVKVILNEDSTKKSTTYLTDEDGTCKLILQNILEGKLLIEADGYFSIIEEYGTSQNKMNLYQLRELSFPLITKPLDQNEVQVLVQTNVEMMPIDLKLISPDNLLVNDNDPGLVAYDYNEESGCLKVTIENINQRRGVFRIFADILEPEYLHPQTLKLYIITHKELKLVDVPKGFAEEPKYWDIGVICAPNVQFLEINTPTSIDIVRDKYLKDYQELLNFLQNSKNMDLKTILGFNDKEKLEVSGDVFVQKEKIRQSLDKYGFESMKYIDYLIASAMMPNGLYSFKRLEQKFNNLQFEFIFEDDKSTSKQKEDEDEDQPYDDDYDL